LINFILILLCDWNCFAQWIGHRGLRPASSWLHYYTTTTTTHAYTD